MSNSEDADLKPGSIDFSVFDFTEGLLFDYSENEFPTLLHAWCSSDPIRFTNEASTFFGYVYSGRTILSTPDNQYSLVAGQYFCVPDSIELSGGKGVVIEAHGYRGLSLVGGPIEQHGRLRYIDGCTDSLLIPPVRKGDPCLNALYFPSGIDQTMHTHPSMRVGLIAAGEGECVLSDATEQLYSGRVFIIHPGGKHKFRTSSKQSMVVIAYHPESDFGPIDEDHPMINRTIVDGVSAANLKNIQTK